MALDKITNQREHDKFVETSGGDAAVRTTIPDGVSSVSATGMDGGPITVSTLPVQITFTGTTKTISIKSASTNTGIVWFGPDDVDSIGGNAYGELTADSAVTLELNDASFPIYCVSDTSSQRVYIAALK